MAGEIATQGIFRPYLQKVPEADHGPTFQLSNLVGSLNDIEDGSHAARANFTTQRFPNRFYRCASGVLRFRGEEWLRGMGFCQDAQERSFFYYTGSR